MLRLALFTPNIVAVEAIAQLVEELPWAALAHGGPFPDARDIGRLLVLTVPEAILVDAGELGSALELVKEIKKTKPSTAIVAFRQEWDSEAQAAMSEVGMTHLLSEPFGGPDLEALVYEAVHQASPLVKRNLFAFLPSKAGAGSSTVALHTAVAFAELNKRVLLIESDRRSGALSFRLNFGTRKGLPEVLQMAGELTPLEWGQHVVDVAGIHVLPANPARPGPMASWADYFQILRFAEQHYDYIVVDLPELVNQGTAEVVRSARSVMIVSSPDGPSLALAGVRFKELESCGLLPEHVNIILNAWDGKYPALEDAATVIGHQVFATIPSDPVSLREALQEFQLVSRFSKFTHSCDELAKSLTGLEEAKPQESKFALFRMLTRLSH